MKMDPGWATRIAKHLVDATGALVDAEHALDSHTQGWTTKPDADLHERAVKLRAEAMSLTAAVIERAGKEG